MYASLLRFLAVSGWDVPRRPSAATPRQPWTPTARSRRCSRRSTQTRGAPAEVCEALVDIDEGVQEWRYRHVKMVERIIGAQAGTGGSAGADYLRATLFRPAFPDLWEVRSRL